MKFSISLLAGVATQAATAFKVPDGAGDGVYAASFAEDGSEVHEHLQDFAGITSRTTPMTSRFEHLLPSTPTKRGKATWCGCGIGMDHGDCDSATHCLEDYLNNGRVIHPYESFYCKRGSVVAFLCEHNDELYNPDRSYAYYAFQDVTNACGWYIAGTRQIDGGLTGGYMRVTDEFCAHDRDSGAGSC